MFKLGDLVRTSPEYFAYHKHNKDQVYINSFAFPIAEVVKVGNGIVTLAEISTAFKLRLTDWCIDFIEKIE